MATTAAILDILIKAKGIDRVQAQLIKLNAEAEKTSTSTDKLEKRFSHLDSTVGDFNRSVMAAGNVVKILKFPSMIAGAGAAAQAIGALGAGAVALTGALGPLSGALAGAGGGAVALGQAMIVGKLATQNLGKALGGNKKALAALTPAQRDFLGQLKAAKKELGGLQNQAAAGLLPGLGTALKIVTPLFRVLGPIVKATGKAMGELAIEGARMAKGWGGDLTRMGNQNIGVIRSLGHAALSLVDAFHHVLIAAGPLTKWMGHLIERGAKWIDVQAKAGRESGRLAGFFEKTRAVIATLGHIIANVGVTLFAFFKGGAPLGRQMLADLEKLTARWREWAGSTNGKNQIAQYFRDAKQPLYALFGLVGDLTGAFARLTHPGKGTTGLANQLRSLVPLLESVISGTTASLGPALVTTLGNVLRVFGALAGSSGPLVLTVKLIGTLAGVLATLLNTVPGLNTMAVTIFGLGSSYKLLGFVTAPLTGIFKMLEGAVLGESLAAESATKQSVIQRIQLVALGIQDKINAAAKAVSTAATWAWNTASKAVTESTVLLRIQLIALAIQEKIVAAASKAWAAAQWLLNAAMDANPIMLAVIAIAAIGAAVYLAYKKFGPFRDAVNFVWDALKKVFGWAKDHWPLLLAILTGPFGLAVYAIAKHGHEILDFVRGLPKKIANVFSGGAGLIVGIGKSIVGWIVSGLKAAVNVLVDFLNKIIDVINGVIPGKGPLGAVKGFATGGKSGKSGIPVQKVARGGKVTMPIAVMGEEAPSHPEWVIPTNPAYRSRAVGLWGQAGHDIGVPGFASGGLLGKAIGSAKYLVKGGVSAVTGKLPSTKGLGLMTAAGEYIVSKVADWIKDKVSAPLSAVGGLFTGSNNVKGLLPRVQRALAWARSHGWSGSVSSGYRSFAEQSRLYADMLAGRRAGPVAKPGTSMHEKGAAVDVTDYPAFLKAMQSAPPDSKLTWFGPGDSVHFSITGARKGGKLFAKGGKHVKAMAAQHFGLQALRRLWVKAGGDPHFATLMAHVAMAESVGDPGAYNNSGATGLWQILGGGTGNLRDPLNNAINAVRKFNASRKAGTTAGGVRGLAPWLASLHSGHGGGWGRWASARDNSNTARGLGNGPSGALKKLLAKHPHKKLVAPHPLSRQQQKASGKGAVAQNLKNVITGKPVSKKHPASNFEDFYQAALTVAQESPSLDDDMRALTGWMAYEQQRYARAKKTGNASEIIAASQAIDSIKGLDYGKYQDVVAGINAHFSAGDYDAAAAAAGMTPGQYATGQLHNAAAWALGGGFGQLNPNDTASVQGDFNATTAGTDATGGNAGQLLTAHTDAINALHDVLARQNAFADSVAGVTSFQAVKAIADLISGQIVGQGYQGRALSASSGQTVRY